MLGAAGDVQGVGVGVGVGVGALGSDFCRRRAPGRAVTSSPRGNNFLLIPFMSRSRSGESVSPQASRSDTRDKEQKETNVRKR